MAESTAAPDRPVNTNIPLLILIAPVVILAVMLWGEAHAKSERAIRGTFPIPEGVKRVRIELDKGELDIRHHSSGQVRYQGKALVAAKSAELLAEGQAEKYRLEPAPSTEADLLVLRVPPIPASLQAVGETEEERRKAGPKLHRELVATVFLPIDLAVELVADRAQVRVDTRQAGVKVNIRGDGGIVAIRTSGPMDLRSGGGKVIVQDHRGALKVRCKGQTRVSLMDLTGEVDLINVEGESDITLPAHASCQLRVQSLEARIHNAFGLRAEPLGSGGQLLQGTLGKGAFKVELINQAGTLTLRKGE